MGTFWKSFGKKGKGSAPYNFKAGNGDGVRTVGIIPNLEKPRAGKLAAEVAAWLSQGGIGVCCAPEAARFLGGNIPAVPVANWAGGVGFGLVLGGDGTILKAARELAPWGIPLLGVNLGRFGFLAELEVGEVYAQLPLFLEGKGEREERMLLAVRSGEGDFLAVNEAVVAKPGISRLINLEVEVNGSPLFGYRADGVVLATPTGSSAYSFSCGGPLVAPNLSAIILTPVCPHSLFSRSLVLDGDARVKVRVEPGERRRRAGRRREAAEGAILSVDGQHEEEINRGGEVSVAPADERLCLLHRPGWSFFTAARRKLGSGEWA